MGTTIVRNGVADEVLRKLPVPMDAWRDFFGDVLTISGGAGMFSVDMTGGGIVLKGEEAISEQEISDVKCEIVLPPDYVAAADVTIVVHVRYTGAGTAASTPTIDAIVKEIDDEGADGADINATAAQDLGSKDAWADETFTITATDLLPGDRLKVQLQSDIEENVGSEIHVEIGSVELQYDAKGVR